MIVDVHIHLSPPDLVANRSPYLAEEKGLSILYSDPKAPLTTTATLLADMDAAGVDKALVMGFPWTVEDNARRHNDWLLEECQKYPGRLYPLAAFDPRAPWAYRHAESFLAAGGYGLGELCVYDEGLTPALLASLEALGGLCKTKGAPMLVHVNEPIGHQYPGKAPMEISQINELVHRSQGVKLILAHFGGGLPLLATIRKEVKEYLTMTYFDTAAMPFLFQPKALAMAYDIVGDHFCLGTDYPLLKTSRYQKYFNESGLSAEAIKGVLGQTAARFLEL
ncbi:MAG: amidohydrolase family protein [Deltaproteobacteria bacterium]|jgi:predicted TIM-barrel fold metal-dependent hydrolase|nr:amidohydrolase family protein [Deltaproteobacteria bacterium]